MKIVTKETLGKMPIGTVFTIADIAMKILNV